MASKGKNFKGNNPALNFISSQAEEAPSQRQDKKTQTASSRNGIENMETASPREKANVDKVPEGYKRDPQYTELKSKRVQLLLQPSLVQAVKDLAKEDGKSMNETVNEAIKEYLERRGK